MADYIYLLEHRLSPAQRGAIEMVREVARANGYTVFLVGGAVRDLTSGSPVRDLDLVLQGNAAKLKKEFEKAGAVITGEWEQGQALFARAPGGVRMEIGSTLSATYPKPGKPVYKPATILEDLRRRDFTANAMALSLNEGSYGLLMDPLNGVADIENRELRLASNYGFIEDPVRMIRAARFMARLGWQLEAKTLTRYETGRGEEYISALGDFGRGYEAEEIVHEEDPLRVLKRLEAEGWMKFLAPYWTSAKANVGELDRLRELQIQLQLQGIHPDAAAANFPLLTAKLQPGELKQLKASFVRQGFVQVIDSLDAETKEFGAQLGAKSAALPSQAWKLIHAARPEVVLWLAFSSKSATLQAKIKSFLTEWPQFRQKIPYTLMQEMRIVPELPEYASLVESLFFELIDGKLTTTEEMKAFLEPYSPPAPPPPVNLRRLRAAAKKEAKSARGRAKKAAAELGLEEDEEEERDAAPAEEEDTPGADADADADSDSDSDSEEEDVEVADPIEEPDEALIEAIGAEIGVSGADEDLDPVEAEDDEELADEVDDDDALAEEDREEEEEPEAPPPPVGKTRFLTKAAKPAKPQPAKKTAPAKLPSRQAPAAKGSAASRSATRPVPPKTAPKVAISPRSTGKSTSNVSAKGKGLPPKAMAVQQVAPPVPPTKTLLGKKVVPAQNAVAANKLAPPAKVVAKGKPAVVPPKRTR